MKKVIIFIVALHLIVLAACTFHIRDNEIRYESGEYFNKNWDDGIGTYKKAVIPDEKTALNVARSIFDGMEKSEDVEKYEAQAVFFDEKDQIWIVSFYQEQQESKVPLTIGGGCDIAIQKSDGKVLRIWFGE